MSIIKIGYGNLCDSSILSGGNWTSGHPLSEIQTRELARYAQSSSADPSATQIIMDHVSSKAAQVFGIIAHTEDDAAATITVTRGTTSGASDVYAGSPLACWPFTPIDGVYNGSHFGIWVITPAETVARYTKIAISGSQVIRIGRLFVGPIADGGCLAYGNYADDWQPANSTVDRTENGADWVTTRIELRSVPLSYSELTPTQASLIHEIMRTHTITGEVALIANTEDRAAQQQYGFLGILRKLSALEYPAYDTRSTALAIDERGGAP